MKSQMIEKSAVIPQEDKGSYTELQVLHSAAGYYVGTLFEEKDADGNVTWQEPGSRDSGYFKKESQAQAFLATLQSTSEDIVAIVTRNHP